MAKMRSIHVSASHDAEGSSSFRIEPGDKVSVGERSADDDGAWPAFVPITTCRGETGWVPQRYLDSGRPTARVITAYETTELPARAGEQLRLIHDDAESGWSWCANSEGREGWIPNDNLSST